MKHLPLAIAATLALAVQASAGETYRGINLPPTQGTTNSGAFLPGVYKFNYKPEDFSRIRELGFNSIRLPVNVATVSNEKGMAEVIAIVSAMDNRAVICMFDTNEEGETGHGNGLPNDLHKMAGAWKRIHQAFYDKSEVRYELFNEPFGYPKTSEGAQKYADDMLHLIKGAGLPEERCILSGMGYADDLKIAAETGWKGALSWHFYNTWLPDGQRTTENYTRYMQEILNGVPNEIHITEFGARLDLGDFYNNESPGNDPEFSNTHLLNGIEHALIQLKKDGREVKGTYYWHGWDNNDSYSIWGESRKWGAAKVRQLQALGQTAESERALPEKQFSYR